MNRYLSTLLILLLPTVLWAQEVGEPEADLQPEEAPIIAESPMTLERLNEIIGVLDPETQTDGRVWQLKVSNVTLLVVTDEKADRLRILSPLKASQEVTIEEMTRMMQANFDTALDARYAIARGTLWATYIHPLSPMEKNEFISGLGQVVNLSLSYGTLYSGGALQYGGGDSGALQRALIDDLLKKGEEI